MYTGIYVCSSQEFHRIDKYPFYIGQGNDVDLRLRGPSISDKQCTVHQGGSKPVLQSHVDSGVRMHGQAVNDLELTDEIYPVIIGNWCVYIVCSNQLDSWNEKLTKGGWCYFQVDQPKSQPQPYRQLLGQFNDSHDPNSFFLTNEHTTVGFSLADLRGSNEEYDANQEAGVLQSASNGDSSNAASTIRAAIKDGEYRCPYCRESFEAKDFMKVATHPELKRDPHLGEGHYLRFKPTRMAGGKDIDPNGSVATELACPHCHLILPRNIKNTPQKIISVVGDAAAGKSYYLSVITKILGDSLPRSFNALYTDATPGGNDVLRRMVNNLWGANSPEEVHMIKTQLYSDSYQEVRIKGSDRTVFMPKAFIFTVTNTDDDEKRTNLVYYDNAGEHFRPENNSADTPGAQHVAQADGIIFLLDPFNHNDFKRKMRDLRNEEGEEDPQLNNKVSSSPDVILDEMKKRISELTDSKRPKVPFAFVVGKCDAWREKMIPNDKKLWDPKMDARGNCPAGLDLGVVEHNSRIIEEMLNDISAGLVARAKSMSDRSMFFATSNFGHPAVPVERPDPENPGKTVTVPLPDPRRLNPELVDIPVLWILSQTDPGIVNSVRHPNLQL